MKYYLKDYGSRLSYSRLNDDVFLTNCKGVKLPCPFVSHLWHTGKDVELMGAHCGSWCPLFQVRERDKIPLPQKQDGPVLNYRRTLEVRLHCGAGTRVIEIEEAK